MDRFKKKIKESNGGSELLSSMLVTLIACALAITILDVGIFMLNRSTMNTAARDGARVAAIMGGVGTSDSATPIENAYGVSKADACSVPESMGFDVSSKTPVECGILTSLAESKGTIRVIVNDVNCTPAVTEKVGEDVSCTVDWSYESLPMAGLSFIDVADHNETSGVAQSEVGLDEDYLEPRVSGSGQ